MQYYSKEKTILTDVDGCLVDWVTIFHSWMKSNGHCRIKNNASLIEQQYNLTDKQVRMLITEFNKTDNIASLPAFDDSVLYVKKLTELGYKFICITSIGLDTDIKNNRITNLVDLFGKNTFLDFIFLKTHQSKTDILKKYKDAGLYWIEDNIDQYNAGVQVGLKSFYLNKNSLTNSWKEIYSRIKYDII